MSRTPDGGWDGPVNLTSVDWDVIRAQVLARPFDGRCERCGQRAPSEAHHRQLRSRRGRNAPSNLTALCGKCHAWCHANPADAEDTGWMVSSEGDPAQIPVRLHHGWQVLLDDLYGYVILDYAA